MPTLKTPFLGGFYEVRSKNQASEECVNLFLELDEEKQGKAPGMLLQSPGLSFLLFLGGNSTPGAGPPPVQNVLLTESGLTILTESGQPILVEP